MPILEILVGPPASGKSTYARDKVLLHDANTWKRVNKDDLRAMIDGGRHSKGSEKLVLQTRDWMVMNYLAHGKNVIVDDTNLYPKHEERLREIASASQAVHGHEVKVIVTRDFCDVDLDILLERNLKRPNSVPPQVVKKMHKQARPDLYPPNNEWYPEAGLVSGAEGDAIIVDIDGVIAVNNGRGWYEWTRVAEDKINEPMVRLLEAFQYHTSIIYLTGRDEAAREETQKWFGLHSIPHGRLLMRAKGDMRKSNVVKREIIEREGLLDAYNIIGAFDDDHRVIDTYKEMGINVMHVPTRATIQTGGEERV